RLRLRWDRWWWWWWCTLAASAPWPRASSAAIVNACMAGQVPARPAAMTMSPHGCSSAGRYSLHQRYDSEDTKTV
ncbi:hypothetical protein COO60DRAFT_1524792, partial [Scenedesmus sp. NREL 46B-D3]